MGREGVGLGRETAKKELLDAKVESAMEMMEKEASLTCMPTLEKRRRENGESLALDACRV